MKIYGAATARESRYMTGVPSDLCLTFPEAYSNFK